MSSQDKYLVNSVKDKNRFITLYCFNPFFFFFFRKMISLLINCFFFLIINLCNYFNSQSRMVGERGSGAGKGGGGGGSIREAGGSFGKMEAANEDQYFYNQVFVF